MHLIIDAGNTLIKLNVINNNEVVYNQAIDELQPQSILHLLKTYSVNSAILASTRALTINDFQPWWPTHIPLLEFDNQLSIPIGINYQTPETLGRDRIAGAVAAWQLFNKQHSLVISLGTAITVDYISDNGYFEGGTISPGMNLRFKSLHAFTGKLPLVEPGLNTELKGESTFQAIQYGVINSIIFEINEYIARYYKKVNQMRVIITGGDAPFFKAYIHSEVSFEPFLVAKGLNKILEYNLKK